MTYGECAGVVGGWSVLRSLVGLYSRWSFLKEGQRRPQERVRHSKDKKGGCGWESVGRSITRLPLNLISITSTSHP